MKETTSGYTVLPKGLEKKEEKKTFNYEDLQPLTLAALDIQSDHLKQIILLILHQKVNSHLMLSRLTSSHM
jgi:hypothetical protein